MANLTTLASGSSITLTVTEGQSIVLNNGTTDKARLQITTGPRAGAVVADNHNGRRVYGPFGAGTITVFAISGSVGYELSGDPESPLADDGDTLTAGQLAAIRASIGGDTSIRSGYYHLAYRGAQAGNGLLLDQSGNNKDAANNTFVFPTGWTASQAVALGAYRAPTNPNAAGFATGLPLFKCTTAGTTGSSEPSWNTTIGGTTSDGTAVWTAEKGPWYTDTGGVRQFRSLLDTQLGSTTAEVGAYSLGVLPWDMASGDSLILSITSLQNYTSGPTNFNETSVAGNRTFGVASAGLTLVASGQTTFNDLRLRISDGTTTRNAAHLDTGGVATNRPGDGSRRTTTYFVDGRTKRMYLCADGVARNSVSNYAGISTTDLVAWDADISGVTGSTSAGVRPFVFGTQPNADGSIGATTYELGASRFDVLVLPARGLPADIISIAQWFHNRGEGLVPAGLVV